VISTRSIFSASTCFDYYKEIFNVLLPGIFDSWQVKLAIDAKLTEAAGREAGNVRSVVEIEQRLDAKSGVLISSVDHFAIPSLTVF
jgi:hypothetical protein